MLHVTCDFCGKKVRPTEDHHYVVKIEAYAAHDPTEITEEDLDEDHMEAVSKLLRNVEADPQSVAVVAPYQNFRYDLCASCHQKFVRDPLGKENDHKLHFSSN
jgi:hypothetical protein